MGRWKGNLDAEFVCDGLGLFLFGFTVVRVPLWTVVELPHEVFEGVEFFGVVGGWKGHRFFSLRQMAMLEKTPSLVVFHFLRRSL